MTEKYVVQFDGRSKLFSKEPGRNNHILEMYQMFANDKLQTQGHLFLNEVLDILGLPRVKAGQRVGWIWRKKYQPNTVIDFGFSSAEDHSFPIPLHLNVDGDILDRVIWKVS